MPVKTPSIPTATPVAAKPPSPTAARWNLFTVNLEDYFQAGAFHQYISPRNWYRFESRLQKNTEETLALLDEHDTKATFFVLGWIAERYPELVRQISNAGHEIASRGFLHQPLLKVTAKAQRKDLIRSKELLEDTIGKEVVGFRLSDGWLRKRDLGFLNELLEAGYVYDSSLMPRRRDFIMQPWRRFIHEHKCDNGGSILEIPPSTMPMGGAWMPIAGGNYLRQLPDHMMQTAIQKWQETETSPFVMYFQTWELDDQQPRLSVTSRLTQMRHYRNLGKYRTMLPQYLKSAKFTSIAEHAKRKSSPLASLEDRTCKVTLQTINRRRRDAEEAARLADSHTLASDLKQTVRTAVTLVIPCYNEESTLPYLHRTMQSLKHELSRNWDLKVLFVDDCSKDNTFEVLKSLFGNDSDVRIVKHETNKGVSAAILTGINAATTDIVASIDADCSYDPHELARMLPLMTKDVAMVTASPYHRDGKVSNVPSWRLVLSHTLSMMYRTLLKQRLSTWTSCFRIYRKQQIVDLPLVENGFLGTAELAAQLSLHGRKIVEHPATLEVRLFGFSKMKTVRTILAHLRLLSKVVTDKGKGPHGAVKN
jgi:polysaccharide deacetylase family protein (PEP-CTERM system associated)